MAGGDAKLSGRAVEVTDPATVAAFVAHRFGDEHAQQPQEPFHLFRADVTEIVRTTVQGDLLVVESWHEDEGERGSGDRDEHDDQHHRQPEAAVLLGLGMVVRLGHAQSLAPATHDPVEAVRDAAAEVDRRDGWRGEVGGVDDDHVARVGRRVVHDREHPAVVLACVG